MRHQYRFQLKPRRRGFHLVTDEILALCPAIREIRDGLMHVFIHLSALAEADNRGASGTRNNQGQTTPPSTNHPSSRRETGLPG